MIFITCIHNQVNKNRILHHARPRISLAKNRKKEISQTNNLLDPVLFNQLFPHVFSTPLTNAFLCPLGFGNVLKKWPCQHTEEGGIEEEKQMAVTFNKSV